MKILLLSPHIDDAVLALGGTLTRLTAGNEVKVYNFFGVSASTRLQAKFPVPLVVLVRWTEELVVSTAEGYSFRNLLFSDTSLTRRKGHPDEHLLKSLTSAVTWAVRRERPDILVVPLAVGEHPDHLAIFDTVSNCIARGEVDVEKCLFYEDMWYSARTEPAQRAKAASQQLATALKPVLIDVTRQTRHKRKLCQMYGSQYPMSAKKIKGVFEYAKRLRGDVPTRDGISFERIWVPSPSGRLASTAAVIAPGN